MSIDAPAPGQVPSPRRKRMTVYDALDGQLARLKGLDEAAVKAKAAAQPKPPLALLRSEEPAPYGDAPVIQQDNPAGQSSTTRQHHKAAPQSNIPAPQSSSSAPQGSTANQQDNPAGQSSTKVQQEIPAPQGSTANRQDNPAPRISTSPAPGDVIHVCLDTPSLARTPAQKRMLRYFEEHGRHVSNYNKIIAETGLRYGTVRDVVERFEKHGVITKEPWAKGSARGILFSFHGIGQQDNPAGQFNTTNQQLKPAAKASTARSHHNPAPQSSALLKIDRKNLSISLETVQTVWPALARAGFGPEQIEQIHAALAQLGKSADRVVQGLDHAEWELAEGKMLDKTGQPVADPCAWVFRSLAGQGYYRRPAGYVSAEEQAERDAVEEARALARTRETARQERFNAWAQGLSREEREKALEGRIGPEEAWLKNVWTSKGEPA